MKDSQRLALLKEVGGTKIYEERRHDSLKLMAESEGRSQRIQEVVCGVPCPPHLRVFNWAREGLRSLSYV